MEEWRLGSDLWVEIIGMTLYVLVPRQLPSQLTTPGPLLPLLAPPLYNFSTLEQNNGKHISVIALPNKPSDIPGRVSPNNVSFSSFLLLDCSYFDMINKVLFIFQK